MYGGSGKLGGRGGGGGGRGSKRNNNSNHHSPYPPPPIHHRSIPPQTGRLSIGSSGAASRNRQSDTKTTSASTQSMATREETFNIVSGNPLAFAMIIRLAPNLVDEIKRVEAHGGTARIKFDVNANNPEGNVIDVGGKDFRFTWSHEPGDLCDIYEERQSGENGSGLLVESGGAWRKLNVQRVLDESTKNHVKMRSEEAERKLKARKAIVLDHGNSSVNNHMKTSTTAAVEGRMASKTRKEPAFKKQKVEPTHASGGPLKSVYKSGLSSTATGKGRLSVSPGLSPPEQSRPSASPLGLGNLSKGQMSVEDIIAPSVTSKEETSNREKEIRRVINAAVPSGNKNGMTGSPIDVRRMLINALKENPKGLNFKALEKAVGDSTVKIKPILEKIATYQAPGRYILNEGVEVESFKKPSLDSGSSPECVPDPAANSEKISPSTFEQHPQLSPQLEVSALVEKIDSLHSIPDLLGDRKTSDHSEERAGSSSDSSSSDSSSSDSSDSGSGSSDSSRSKSLAGSGSGSSSDSESDGSSSNKEGSDVDVDIMTSDDEKEDAENKVQKPESGFSISPHPLITEFQNEQNGANEDKQAGQLFGAVGNYREPPDDDNETGLIDITGSTPSRATGRSMQERLPSPDLNLQGQSQQFSGNVGNKRQNTKDGVRLEHHDSPEGISSSDLKFFEEKYESSRRIKAGHSAQPPISGRNKGASFNQNQNYLSPNRSPHDLSTEQTMQVMDSVGNPTADTDLQKSCGSSMPERSQLDAQQSSQRNADLRAPGNDPDVVEAPKKYVQNTGRGSKNIGKGPAFQDELDRSTFGGSSAYDKFSTTKDKVNRETLDGGGYYYEKSLTKNVKQGVVGDKTPMPVRPQYRKNGEQAVNLKDAGQTMSSDVECFPKDCSRMDTERSLTASGRGSILRREPSELELGELREPMHIEDSQGANKKFEKKNSFKLPESNSHATDHPNLDLNKGRATGKINQETRKQLSPDSGVRVFGNQEDASRKRTVGDDIEEATRPHQGNSLPDIHQFPRVDHADPEVGFELNKPADRGSKSRKHETRKSKGKGTQGNENTSRKASVHGSQRHGAKNEAQIVSPKIVKEKKSRKSNAGTQLKTKDNYLIESSDNSQRKRESSPDEDNSAYFKYEKDEPELKGPIKDFSKYKEYVQEYHEKYGSYCSLNKSLVTYRNKFSRLGHNLQLAKDTDLEEYYKLVEQLRENYRQYGGSHKRLKKIFLVLHEELKHLKKSIKDFAVSYAKD